MKKLILIISIIYSARVFAQNQYKYCELVGYGKIFSSKITVGIDSGNGGNFNIEMIRDTTDTESEAKIEFKNEKFYVNTTNAMYEGKTVQSDAKGKFIWKKVEVNSTVNKPTTNTAKPKLFNSMVDGMNFMGKDGWEFVQAYVVTAYSNHNVYHWLLKKKK